MYRITDYTKQKAKELNVNVKRSTNKNKKIDIYKNGVKIASVGAIGYNDYPTYMITNDKAYAHERRRLYRIRHNKDRNVKNSNGYYADRLLW